MAGSFRDPSGIRLRSAKAASFAIDETGLQVLSSLAQTGVLAELGYPVLWAGHLGGQASEGRGQKSDIRPLTSGPARVVGSESSTDPALLAALSAEHPGFTHFLEHQVVRPITYPYEWSVSMLADAGVQTIDLQLRLLAAGCGLKDASAYNIQFVGGRPTFIDLASIERPRRLDLWFALGQFQQMFLFPLLLCRYRGWDLRAYFLANLGGCGVEQVARGFGPLGLLRPGLLLDVTLPLLLTRWAEKSDRAWQERLQGTAARPHGPNCQPAAPAAQSREVGGGLSTPRRLGGLRAICNYSEQAEQAKKSLVGEFLRQTRPRRVVDLGCNTGDYSRLAAECGADVVAVDADQDAVEVLYRQLRRQPAAITPMVVDLGNPSPALGFMNRERSAFVDRVRGDCVLALALLHHLLVAGNLSLEAICEMFAAL